MKKIAFIILIASVFACSKKSAENVDTGNVSSSDVNYALDSIPSQEIAGDAKDPSRKFIRTAELRFKVKNVRQATTEIENAVTRFNGFITHADLTSTVLSLSTIPLSTDSILETTKYMVENNIELRIPNTALDTTLRSLAKLIQFLDHSTIKAEDVKLQILSNQLTQKRIGKHEERLIHAVEKRGKKLNETTNAEESLLDKIEQRDQAVIDNLNLKDKVDYSTITINIYQKETISKSILANTENVHELKSPFAYSFIESLKTGWYIFTEIVLFLLKIWPILILIIIAYLTYRYIKIKK